MKITAIRSERIYRDMMTALPDEKENIYRNRLMKPFEFEWACVGIPLTATQKGGYDVVSAAPMSGFYAPVQITEARRTEIEKSCPCAVVSPLVCHTAADMSAGMR